MNTVGNRAVNRNALDRPRGMAVVLVEPENAANVGFIARTLTCYGVEDCRIVGSPGIGEMEAAKKTGKGARQVLGAIQYFDNLPAAIADCHFAMGFTRRVRESGQPSQGLHHMVAEWREMKTDSMQTALVFGRESQGLSREESLLLSHLVTIPMFDATLSLNLSHAVAIGLYAFLGDPSTEPRLLDSAPANKRKLPTQQENAAALDRMLLTLEKGNFFRGGKASAQKEYARMLWQRLKPNQQELDFLAGLLKRLPVHS